MTLTLKDKIISSGIFVAIVMGIFPPWLEKNNNILAGYNFIFAPEHAEGYRSFLTIHYDILILQWIVVGLVTFLLVYLNKSKNIK